VKLLLLAVLRCVQARLVKDVARARAPPLSQPAAAVLLHIICKQGLWPRATLSPRRRCSPPVMAPRQARQRAVVRPRTVSRTHSRPVSNGAPSARRRSPQRLPRKGQCAFPCTLITQCVTITPLRGRVSVSTARRPRLVVARKGGDCARKLATWADLGQGALGTHAQRVFSVTRLCVAVNKFGNRMLGDYDKWSSRDWPRASPTTHTHNTPNGACVRARLQTLVRSLSGGRANQTFDTRSYLVDPASSHMLVSKIKPCMSKYKPLIR
jgi:hypothetical protein